MKFLFKILTLSFILTTCCSALDYQKPDFSIEHLYLTFELDDYKTCVTSQLEVNRETDSSKANLVLDGERLKLISVTLNKKLLKEGEYQLDDKTLTIFNVPDHFCLTVVNEINPIENTSLEGLYKTDGIFCTQNESLGFRKITYFLDRPDVMTKYTTKIIADQNKNPILLSNGNKIDSGVLDNNRHFATFEDPYKKPSYLFALVAGDLDCIEDTFVRKSGKPVELKIFSEKHVIDKCHYAMDCLKRAMKWDEDNFGLVCDLDNYMIVAIDAFNAGAMENKGLNIFNSAVILANSKTASDYNYKAIEGVIGHEYFHNWTGNRVTLREWSELNVKEALTVFRDQEFSLDMNSWSTQRVEDVQMLKIYQFPEDAGPTAHSIRPTEPVETCNLYTATVYQKGPEVIRMIQTLIGKETFRKGMDKYFELYDGQAVTTDQFVYAMELASKRDLSQFKRWYDQKGTPHVKVSSDYDIESQRLTLHIEQSNPREGENALPLHFPFKLGLLDADGNDFNVPSMLEIKEKKEVFVFENITTKPVLSLNRDFSAPVIVEADYNMEDCAFLMAHDSNDYTRFEANRELTMSLIQSLVNDHNLNKELKVPQQYFNAFQNLLNDQALDQSLKAMALKLPPESEISQSQKIIDFDGNYYVRNWLKKELATLYEEQFLNIYQNLSDNKPYTLDSNAMAKRELKNTCLGYLTALEKPQYIDLATKQFNTANNMTDQFAALCYLNQIDCRQRRECLDSFYAQFNDDALVMNKWLSVEASSHLKVTPNCVQELLRHPIFDYKNPNKARALLGSFMRNSIHFHATDGSGYNFIAEQILVLDKINPQVAARLCEAFREYPKLDNTRKKMMKETLETLINQQDLSANSYEIISKSLNDN